MKRNIVWAMVFFATLLLGLPALADKTKAQKAKDDYTCSNADIAGDWGTIMTGTIIRPPGAVPFAAVNRATYDSAGNYWGTQTRSINGTVTRVTFQGTYTVDSDCTGTKITKSYDQSGNLLNTVTQDFVLMNNAKELFEILTSNTLPDGTIVSTLITGNSKKLFSFPWVGHLEENESPDLSPGCRQILRSDQ